MTRRFCCDGLCAKDQHCPAFAPGVIEVYAPSRRIDRRLRCLLSWLFCSGVVMLLAALIGFAVGVLS